MHKTPDEHANGNDDRKVENGIHPLYPTSVQHPFDGVQVPVRTTKPTKTPTTSPKIEPPSKYDYDNYDEFEDEDDEDEEDENGKKTIAHIGPGFFNPQLTKHQYGDYDQGIFNNDNFQQRPKPQKPNQYNPYVIQHGDGKHELINILGGNLPPHLHIEHILQQIQGGGNGGVNSGSDINGQSQSPYGMHQMQHGLNYPFGIGQHPLLPSPNGGNQKIPVQPQGNRIFYVCNFIFVSHRSICSK